MRVRKWRVRWTFILFALALANCATATPINAPLREPQLIAPGRPPAGNDLIVMALSGGGARAASFSLGVLQGLRDTPGADGRPLSEHIALISSVSGGSVLTAYYALHGEPGLDTFRAAYLDKAWRVRRQTSPLAILGAIRGGMNGPAQLADWLDREVYDGARMAALGTGPRAILNASDLYNATPFAFTPFYFDAICSTLAPVRVADAVAASMAAPVLFRPVLAEAFPDAACPEPDWAGRLIDDRTAPESARATAFALRNYRGAHHAGQHYVLLGDGGLTDNLGLLSLSVLRAAAPVPAPLTPREAVQARRIMILVVNAEYVRDRTFQQRATDAVGAYEMMYAPLDASVDAAKRSALDTMRASLPEFERDLRAWRCGLTQEAAQRFGAPADWACDALALSLEVITLRDMQPDAYERYYATPTDVSLPSATVSALVSGGHYAVEHNSAVAALRGD